MSETSPSAVLPSVLAFLPVGALFLVVLLLLRRRVEMKRFERSHLARTQAKSRGSHKARLLHPEIDLSKCIGCGACVRACPEDGVLDLLHGQAVVVHGARCVGHGRCAEACPTSGIALTFADLERRSDLPVISEEFEAIGVPGLYLAGELTGFSLVRTAVSHGASVATAIARKRAAAPAPSEVEVLDLLVVGAGPAGVSCALRAKELDLAFRVIDQADEVGGTVAAYPRRKLVMTQPMHLPLHGKLPELEYQKEDLVNLWDDLSRRHALPIQTGVRLTGVVRDEHGVFTAHTSAGAVRARNVCLALGRRGTPRKLGVPGEELSKVQYNLLDAESYKNRRIVVVGGGDSAAEAAIGLAEQMGNLVTLCCRDADWTRIKSKNEGKLHKAAQSGRLVLQMRTNVRRIDLETVTFAQATDAGEQLISIPNDDVFVFAGGDPPFALLARAGVSFDPAKRPTPATTSETSSALLWAVSALLVVSVAVAAWAVTHQEYYTTSLAVRTLLDEHEVLRPAGKVGLFLGCAAVTLFVWNLAYLARRSTRLGNILPGSLRFWMASHVFTGLASFLAVIVHAGFTYRMTVGGFAFVALGIVLIAGLVGRYFYAIVPHAANGREMDLDELRARLATLAGTWDASSRGLGRAIRDRIDTLVNKERWHASLLARAWEMVASHFRIRRILHQLRDDPGFEGVPQAERDELLALAKRSWKLTLQIAHYEELRAVLGTWRFIHGWLALLMVLFVIAHVVTAVRYAKLDWPLSNHWFRTEEVAP